MKARNIFAAILILLLIVSCSDREDHSTRQRAPVQEATGQQLFESKCTACHGTDGTAGVGNAANLKLSKLDSNQLFKTINEGRNGMPSFKNSLTPVEVHKLTNYVETLRK